MNTPFATEWSNDFTTIPVEGRSCTEETQDAEEANESKKPQVVGNRFRKQIEHAIVKCQLKEPNSSNRGLFALARRIRAIESSSGVKLGHRDLAWCFERWYNSNQQFLRPENDYFIEFLVKLNAVRFPYGSNLTSAVERAKRARSPSAMQNVKDKDAHLVAKLCRELQHDAGLQPFFLTGRACAEAIGRPHRTIASWLQALQSLQIIQLLEQGRQGRGSRYRYIAPD